MSQHIMDIVLLYWDCKIHLPPPAIPINSLKIYYSLYFFYDRPHNYSKEKVLFFSDLMEIKLSHQEMEVNGKCDNFKFLQLQSLDVKVFLTMQNKHNQ